MQPPLRNAMTGLALAAMLMLAVSPLAAGTHAPGRVCEGAVDLDCYHFHIENGPWFVETWYHCEVWLDAPYQQGAEGHPGTWLLTPCLHW